MPAQSTRRSFVAGGLGASAALGFPNFFEKSDAIRLGGPVFLKSDHPGALAREHRRLGYSAAYVPQVKLSDSAHIRAIEKAFAAQKVVIAEVGAWKNMLEPDTLTRRDNLAYVTERCALAEAVGARCCVDIAGTYNPRGMVRPASEELIEGIF